MKPSLSLPRSTYNAQAAVDNESHLIVTHHVTQQTNDKREVVLTLRKSTVEPVFGVIKHVMGFRRFHLRGFNAGRGEWNLVCMAWNLKRLHALAA